MSPSTLKSGHVPSWERLSSDRGPYEIVLAEDDPSTLAVVKHALESDGFRVVAEARDAAEAVAAVVRHRPDVCLLEVDLPGAGIKASQAIWSKLPDARIAMLASSVAEDNVVRAINAGADGYLLKSSAQGRLAPALRAVARGETALPRVLTGRFVDQMRRASVAEPQIASTVRSGEHCSTSRASRDISGGGAGACRRRWRGPRRASAWTHTANRTQPGSGAGRARAVPAAEAVASPTPRGDRTARVPASARRRTRGPRRRGGRWPAA